MEDQSALLRLQTFYIVVSNGAKIKRPEQLWRLKSDVKQSSPVVNMNADEYRDWYNNIKKKYKIR